MTYCFRYLSTIFLLSFAIFLSADEPAGGHSSDRQYDNDPHLKLQSQKRHGSAHKDSADKTLEQGPRGGRWLTHSDIALELTVFEAGIKPEMRVYAYRDGVLLAPGNVDLTVRLTRLDGDSEQLNFSAEKDYLVSSTSVAEPHSYDVDVSAHINNQHYQWAFESYQGRSEISDRLLLQANVKTERAQSQVVTIKDTLFGVIAAPTENVYRINAPYSGLVEQVLVSVGDQVKKGQPLVRVKNTETLQSYIIKSPAAGGVTTVAVNAGDRAEIAVLLEIADLSQVWVELSAFPQSIENLAVGQRVSVYDLHQHQIAETSISYIAPKMTGGHIARARAVINNAGGHWRPGMHVKADVQISRHAVSLAVRKTALQTIQNNQVVFVKYANVFEMRSLELGVKDDHFVEVLDGLKPGVEYVTENSFLLKADVLKAGASHSH